MSDIKEKNKSAKKRSKASTAVFAIIIAVLGCIIIYAGYRVVSALITYQSAKDYYEDVRELFAEETIETLPDVSDETVAADDKNLGIQKFRFDFSKLTEINPESVGYLKARGTDSDDIVDYPVVQGVDNEYYLTHMFSRQPNKTGAIFMDCDIKDGFEARNCIIYGHNMYAGARMFGCLSKYTDYDYCGGHQEMDVYTADKHYVYKVFTAFTADTTGFAYQYGFADDQDFMNFINKALEARPFDMGIGIEDFNADSKIITLSTCLTDYRSDKRFVVMLLRTEELDY